MSPAIEATGLAKRFRSRIVLSKVDLWVDRGRVLAVLGPNGAGKTTTVGILTTLLRPDAGRAAILGRDVVRDAGLVRRVIGVTGQYAAVDADLTARENLVLSGRLQHLGRRGAVQRADELLERLGLAAAADRRAGTLSGGMRRRLDLAACLVHRPPVLFLDEPTTGLDPRSRRQLWDLTRELVLDGTAVLLTTQYLEEADQLADRIAVIDHGRVVVEGSPDELRGGRTLDDFFLELTEAAA